MLDHIEQRLQRLLAAMGSAVIISQSAEGVLAVVLETALPGVDIITLDTIHAERRTNAKATLGRLLSKLRERVHLDRDFDAVLSTFLEDRNAFIHDLHRVPGFDLNTVDGLAVAEVFINRLIENSRTVLGVLGDLMLQWSKLNGYQAPVPEGVLRMIGQFDGKAFGVFFAKEPTDHGERR